MKQDRFGGELVSETLGDVLKRARMEKGLTLDEIQEMTKIRKRYLQAIEAGNFSDLPGSFYVRAFIKSYAEAVQLNPNELLQLYKNSLPSDQTAQPIVEPVKRKRRYNENSDKITKWASLFFLICFVLLISSIIYYFIYNKDHSSDSNYLDDTPLTERMADLTAEEIGSEKPPLNEPPPSQNESEHEPEKVEPEQPEPSVNFVNTDRETYIYNVTNTDALEVEMVVTGDRCWVQVKKDNNQGEDIEGKMYYKDEVQVWEADHSLWIRLGAPRTVAITVNGHELEEFESSSPVNLQLNLVQFQSEQSSE